ncbi:hypothetical protein GCM10010361_12740 [Streptomyces olivaceiscleroticus]|uniref:Uncharacterized protein n=1 Tax=Streptomyces olivaceiscleroticus TaxID=68245 RepID=A0ABN0ZJM1_9ACTN
MDPDVSVRFHGTPGRVSASESTRSRLPHHVAAGVDYTDVEVDYLLATLLTQHAQSAVRLPAGRRTPDG